VIPGTHHPIATMRPKNARDFTKYLRFLYTFFTGTLRLFQWAPSYSMVPISKHINPPVLGATSNTHEVPLKPKLSAGHAMTRIRRLTNRQKASRRRGSNPRLLSPRVMHRVHRLMVPLH